MADPRRSKPPLQVMREGDPGQSSRIAKAPPCSPSAGQGGAFLHLGRSIRRQRKAQVLTVLSAGPPGGEQPNAWPHHARGIRS